jgi:hypothetical protein
LNALSKEINGLKNNLGQYTLKMVCDENDEHCMKSCCHSCKNNFTRKIMQKVMNKAKVMSWYQWTIVGGRVEKKQFSGMNERFICFCS